MIQELLNFQFENIFLLLLFQIAFRQFESILTSGS